MSRVNVLRSRSIRISVFALATALATGAVAAAPGDLDVAFNGTGIRTYDSLDGGETIGLNALAGFPDNNSAGGAAGPGDSVYFTTAVSLAGNGQYQMSVVKVLPNGNFDPNFGVAGIAGITKTVGSDNNGAVALAVQPNDGKIVVVGSLETGSNTDWGIARFTTGGTPDTSFGGSGTGYITFNVGEPTPNPARNDVATAVAIQSDGKIVVGGYGYNETAGVARFSLLRLTDTGTLDMTFGSNGRVISAGVSATAGYEMIDGFALRPNGRLANDDSIIAFGKGTDQRALLRKYLANGQPDTTFGTNGVVSLVPITGNPMLTEIRGAVLLDNGQILLGGLSSDRGFAFMRLNANGGVDATFGTNGRTLVKFSSGNVADVLRDLKVQRNGKIVAAGRIVNGSTNDFGIVRLTAAGLLDTTFSPTTGDGAPAGIALVPIPSSTFDEANALAISDTGRIVAAGFATITRNTAQQSDLAFVGLLGDDELFSDSFE